MPRVFIATLTVAAVLGMTAGVAEATPVGLTVPTATAEPGATSGDVFAVTDRLAGQVAATLADRAARNRTASATASGPADLLTLESGTELGQASRDANLAVLKAKGLPATGGSLLRVRLANPEARAALSQGEVPLVAAAPSDDEPTAITAYDPLGGKVTLDPAKAPQRPVLIVDVDVTKALPLGLQVMRDTLAAGGIKAMKPVAALAETSAATTAAADGYWATKVNTVQVADLKEPWFKGNAEIYSIVGGFGLDSKPTVNIVQMPYLDKPAVTYSPNQLLVHFSAYKYNLADIVMMEDDGDTNYLQLAQAIVTILLTIVDGGTYAPLVNAILSAMPASWWVDDPDYVDSWYTLSTTSRGRLNGASANGWLNVSPYWVAAL